MLKRFLPQAAIFATAVILSACQSSDTAGTMDVAGTQGQPPAEAVTQAELEAYCPRVSLREGTAYFSTYEKGGEGQQDRVRYQASINDVTRSCNYADQGLVMTVGAAGRVVLGPRGSAGTITMPIRVAVVEGDTVLYSQLHQHTVQVGQTGATQFIFTDPGVNLPKPSGPNYIVFVGYDEGPYNTQ
ncbi:MAG: hypothetical protein CMJ42_12890 [Phyllobacteriaceae bacterium]|nr:hypothetical protein [Phyllobacteriaceae bacterium]MBA90882.1 hypothetical protein [Phyllobacteriaceae bacterium]